MQNKNNNILPVFFYWTTQAVMYCTPFLFWVEGQGRNEGTLSTCSWQTHTSDLSGSLPLPLCLACSKKKREIGRQYGCLSALQQRGNENREEPDGMQTASPLFFCCAAERVRGSIANTTQ
jgi:hypothetical protein